MRGAVIAIAMMTLSVPARAETIRLCAAGSLKAAMADITSAFEAAAPGRRGIAYW